MEIWLQIVIGVIAAILLIISLVKMHKDEVKFIWVLVFLVSLGALLFVFYADMSETQRNTLINTEFLMH